jgi:hypothetical protein
MLDLLMIGGGPKTISLPRTSRERLAVARQSKVLLIRTAAERLAARGRCLP